MRSTVTVIPLRERPELCAFFARQFEIEWPDWYGPNGKADAAADLKDYANPAGELPVGVVALDVARRNCRAPSHINRKSLPSGAVGDCWFRHTRASSRGNRRRSVGRACRRGCSPWPPVHILCNCERSFTASTRRMDANRHRGARWREPVRFSTSSAVTGFPTYEGMT
jgi:hypothetical protein